MEEEGTYHGIGKCGRDGDEHPPYNALEELLSTSLDQRLDDRTIHFGYTNADEGS